MYDQYYGFTGRPFQLTPDPAFYFESGTHRKAMSYLGYGLAQGEGFIVITGDVGAVSGQNVIRGSRLVVNSATGDAQMEAGAKGPGKARPRAVIYPNQQAGQTASRR